MHRHTRKLLLTTLTCVAVIATVRPSSAEGIPQQAADRTPRSISTGPAFLVAGMAQVAQPQTPPPAAATADPEQNGVGVGVKGGFLWPSIAEAQGSGFKDNTGWLLGIFFGGNRGGAVGVMGEIQYGKQSASEGANDFSQYFVQIPILARVNMGSRSLNGVLGYFLVGPAFDIKLKSKLKGVEIKDKYESLDIGLLIGGGVEITRFLVEARYNKGLKNVLQSTGGLSSDIKTHSFAVELGVRFN